jgi:hypothetical protein
MKRSLLSLLFVTMAGLSMTACASKKQGCGCGEAKKEYCDCGGKSKDAKASCDCKAKKK